MLDLKNMQPLASQKPVEISKPQPPKEETLHPMAIEFNGSGSEYFRIWIVNLLLTMVTLGIYHPWAKVRRLQYFHANTLVDGEPLGFHGKPLTMLKGYILVGVLFTLYSVAGGMHPVSGLLAFLVIAALAPALLKSSLQFRLANTSWRGLRFRFVGSLGGAYSALVPLLIPTLITAVALIWIQDPKTPPTWYRDISGLIGLVALAVGPWVLWNFKQYQHNHYAWASLQTTFKAQIRSFYAIALKLFLLAFLVGIVFALVIPAAVGLGFGLGSGALVGVLVVLSSLAFFSAFQAYWISATQNLVWTKTGNSSMRFRSDLPFKSTFALNLKNWFLIAITLGLYWPFAKVAMARLRLEAVRIESLVDLATLASEAVAQEGDAAGDAAGDLFGLDIGL